MPSSTGDSARQGSSISDDVSRYALRLPLLYCSLRRRASPTAHSGASFVWRSCHSPVVGSCIETYPNWADQVAMRPRRSAPVVLAVLAAGGSGVSSFSRTSRASSKPLTFLEPPNDELPKLPKPPSASPPELRMEAEDLGGPAAVVGLDLLPAYPT